MKHLFKSFSFRLSGPGIFCFVKNTIYQYFGLKMRLTLTVWMLVMAHIYMNNTNWGAF